MREHLVGYSYFGRSRGLQKVNGGDLPIDFPVNDIVDLDPSVFEIQKGQQLLRISRVDQGDSVLHFISMYEYAKEKAADRKGAFVGATIMLADCIAPAEYIVACLVEMLGIVKRYLSDNEQRFTVSELKDESIASPMLFDALKSNVSTRSQFRIGRKKVFFQLDKANSSASIFAFIQEALESETLHGFEELYATQFSSILKKKDKIDTVPYINGFKSEIDSLKDVIAQKETYCSDLDERFLRRKEELKIENNAIERKLKDAKSVLLKVEKDTNDYENQISTLKEKETKINTELESKKKELDKVKRDLSVLNEKELNKSNYSNSKSNRDRSKKNNRYKVQIENLEKERNENKILIEKLTNENSELKKKPNINNTEIFNLKQTIIRLTQENKNLTHHFKLEKSKNNSLGNNQGIEKKKLLIIFREWLRRNNSIIGIVVISTFLLTVGFFVVFLLRSDVSSSDIYEPSEIILMRREMSKYLQDYNHYSKRYYDFVKKNSALLSDNRLLKDSIDNLLDNYLNSGYRILEFNMDTSVVITSRIEAEQLAAMKEVIESFTSTRKIENIDEFVRSVLSTCSCCSNYDIDECQVTIPIIK